MLTIPKHQTKSRSVLIRLTPDLHNRLDKLGKEFGYSVTNMARAIIIQALTEGVKVIKKNDPQGSKASGVARR